MTRRSADYPGPAPGLFADYPGPGLFRRLPQPRLFADNPSPTPGRHTGDAIV